MALINRVSRLFKADFHAVLDQIEEPEQMLRQAVRDMEDELAATERQIADRNREQGALKARREEIAAAIREFDDQLNLCFESGKDDLARGLIRKKLEAERIVKQLDNRIAGNQEFLDGQQQQADENRIALDSLRQKAEAFSHRSSPSGSKDIDDASWLARELTVSDDEVEIAFLREQSRRAGA
jgi:phage shock protein A